MKFDSKVVLIFLYLSNVHVSAFESLFLPPKSAAQVKFKKIFNTDQSKIILNVGTAGTGKTLFSCQEAISSLIKKEKNNIIITRPCISVDNEQMGFLPGDLNDKMDPWMRPCMDYFKPFLGKSGTLLKKIEICPIAYMRGRTFDNSIIIVEEAQNTTPVQMKLILTRIGHNSKIIINGDLTQSDVSEMNGLQDFMNRISLYYENEKSLEKDGFHIIKYEPEFTLRNPIIKSVDAIYA
jgi:phosphate starvation-inducible PhoH-like protein